MAVPAGFILIAIFRKTAWGAAEKYHIFHYCFASPSPL
jgi:hypothetical protein